MTNPTNYSKIYRSLTLSKRKLVLATLRKWGGWTKTTVYRKIDGESVTPIEKIMLDGVFSAARRNDAKQLEIKFEWDVIENSPKMNLRKFGQIHKNH